MAAPSVEAGCIAANVPKTVFYRWLKRPAFADALTAARDEFVREALQRLRAGVDVATRTLIELAGAADQSSVRLGAARAIIEHVVKIQELAVLEQRVAALEALASGGGRGA